MNAPIEAAEAGGLALPWIIRGDWVVNANGYAVCTPPPAERALIVDRVNGWDTLVSAVFRARGDLKEIGMMLDHGEHKSAARLALDAWDHINRAWQDAGRASSPQTKEG